LFSGADGQSRNPTVLILTLQQNKCHSSVTLLYLSCLQIRSPYWRYGRVANNRRKLWHPQDRKWCLSL